jgi:hypothetical protein
MSLRIGAIISNYMQNPAKKSQIWKAAMIIGVSLTVLGFGAGYLDEATHSEFDFIDGYFVLAVLLGAPLSFVAIIGWAKQFGPKTQLQTTGIVFATLLVAALIGYRIDALNAHGVSGLLLLIVPGAVLVALVPLVMAGY